MFDENFSFDTPASPSLQLSTSTTRDTSRSVSPCSAASPYPPPRFSVTDLAAQFSSQRIQRQSQICYDSCESYANLDDDADWSIPTIDEEELQALSRSRTFPQRSHSPSRRVQRQVNTRLLCSTTHHRDIATLVARMVESEDQCLVASSEPPTPTEQEDEGYNSSDDLEMIDTSRRSSLAAVRSRPEFFRRATEMSRTGASVRKNVRIRKDSHRRIRNSEKS